MPLAPGEVFDRFTIVARLGTGGMGEVYRARDARLEREVALKILHGAGDTGAKLLREARAAAALDHPNVVAVYDVGEAYTAESTIPTPYLSMELVDGESLRSYVGNASISLDVRIGWLAEIARALGAAHQRGLVHRDVKPANVMIRRDGRVKVLDFGIAKQTGPRTDGNAPTQTNSFSSDSSAPVSAAGTPAYMSPEQLLSEPIDGRTDQFAWGVTAYELLCGERPWLAETSAYHLAAEVLSREPLAPIKKNAAIPAHVSDVIVRALSKSREQRFATMDELAAALGSGRANKRALAGAIIGVAASVAVAAMFVLTSRSPATPTIQPTTKPAVGPTIPPPAQPVAQPIATPPVAAPPSITKPLRKAKPKAQHHDNAPPLFYPERTQAR